MYAYIYSAAKLECYESNLITLCRQRAYPLMYFPFILNATTICFQVSGVTQLTNNPNLPPTKWTFLTILPTHIPAIHSIVHYNSMIK